MRFLYGKVSFLLLCITIVPSIFAQSETVELLRDEAFVDFPESVDFRLVANANTAIEKAELSYGVSALSCGDVTAVYAPTFSPTNELDLTWR